MKVKEDFVFPLSQETINAIKENHHSKVSKLAHEINAKTSSVKNLLMNFYFLKRGNVGNPKVKEEDLEFVDLYKGHLTFAYSVDYALGCSDSGYMDEDRMKFTFEIDITNRFVLLKEIDYPEREFDEI